MADTLTIEPQSEEQLVLTTSDNPYNPKEDYPKWRQWDIENGYNTEEFIARLLPSNIDIDDEVAVNNEINNIVQEVIEHNVLGVYVLV